jgi:uncharacterized protein
MLSPKLIRFLRSHFALHWQGIHGAPHWARVKENGLRLASSTGADVRVVEAFAFVHDSCRLNDGHDPEHGSRSAELARSINHQFLQLDARQLDLLADACTGHSEGYIEADITVCTCWDADRLDLGRVGIVPRADRLCTLAARDPALIQWAYQRSIRRLA